MKTPTSTTDLGHDWFASQYDDGTMTIRSPERGQRIELPRSSVSLLRSIIQEADTETSLQDLLDAQTSVSRSSRIFIHGICATTNGRVYAHLEAPGSRNVVWASEVPSPEHDILTGLSSDEARAVYEEVRDNAPVDVSYVTTTDISGPRVMLLRTADYYGGVE